MTEDAEYWVAQVPPVNPLNAAVEYELGKDIFDLLYENGMVFEGRATKFTPDRGIFQNWGAFGGGETQVSKPVIAHGLNHVIKLCRLERERILAEGDKAIRSTYQLLRKYYLLDACIISCEGDHQVGEPSRDLAEEMAAQEADPEEKAVLLKIADVCRHVPGRTAPR
jgi:formate C-acetyltransferase